MGQDNAELIAEARDYVAEWGTDYIQRGADMVTRLADALERVTPRVVMTVAELETAVPCGAVLRDARGDIVMAGELSPADLTWITRSFGVMRGNGSGSFSSYRSEDVPLPATVLFTPTGKETE